MHAITTYNDVHQRFQSTRKPPRSKNYNENQRPLRRVTESHLMLQKDPHSYVVKINNVEVARYFEPDEDGHYQIAVRGLYATYDINLMSQYTRLYSRIRLQTTANEQVVVPLNPHYKDVNKDFSAVLTFDKSDLLVVEKSWHADVFKYVSSAEDKALRKNIKQQLEGYITLQMFKLSTLKENVKVDARQGAPFGEEGLHYQQQRELQSFLETSPICVEDFKFMELFDEVSQDAFNMLASKKVYASDERLFYRTGGYYGNRAPEDAARANQEIADIVDSITPDEHKKSLIHRLLKHAKLSMGTQKVALPQFGNTLPRKIYY